MVDARDQVILLSFSAFVFSLFFLINDLLQKHFFLVNVSQLINSYFCFF